MVVALRVLTQDVVPLLLPGRELYVQSQISVMPYYLEELAGLRVSLLLVATRRLCLL